MRRLTIHLSDINSIAQHLKMHLCPTTELRNILSENNNIITAKLEILETLLIRTTQAKHKRFNFKTISNVLKCL